MENDRFGKRLKNKYHESYGLIVTTQDPPEHVVMVERKIPYSLQNALAGKLGKVAACMKRRAYEKTFLRDAARSTATKRVAVENEKTKGRCFRNDADEDAAFLRGIVSDAILACTRDSNPHDEDFKRYAKKLAFEDQYDFPHGQMSAKTKHVLNDYKPSKHTAENESGGNGGVGVFREGKTSDDDDEREERISHTFEFVKKTANFLTAFNEFEEETGYTFAFDMYAVLESESRNVTFRGLDGFEYDQTFYRVRVDRLEKSSRDGRRRPSRLFDFQTVAGGTVVDLHTEEGRSSPRRTETDGRAMDERDAEDPETVRCDDESSKKRKRKIFKEFDEQTYSPRLLEVEEARKLLYRQQKELGKKDFKYRLLFACGNQKVPPRSTRKGIGSEEDRTNEKMCEDYFLEFVRKISPDVFKRCVRRIRVDS